MTPSASPRRLAQESSPYLRQHADNPVDWYPWGEEALSRARAEKKPILLSIGYSACHWCHVMAHESFEAPKIAALMNQHFVCIKVDREERPDLDQLYQGVVQLMGRGGGWPLTVFLTPDLRPFFGGTYFPPEDRHGLPGFSKVLLGLHETWESQPKEVEQQAEDFMGGLAELATYGLEAPPGELTVDDIVQCARKLESVVDRRNGGFGRAPKFPNPMNVALLMRGGRRGGGAGLTSAALLSLRQMARGGIYDQLGGGFHRYSVDAEWRVPHFEKMLYDNAQLLHLYAEAEQLAPDPLWRKVVQETAAYVQREMTAPEGGFYTAQDADSEGEEGKFFAWSLAEVRELLPAAQAEQVVRHFGLTEAGNFEHGRSVLEVKEPSDVPELAAALHRMFEARERRVKPGLDDKRLAGWNGLMIRGLAFAGQVFDRSDWVGLAARAADFVLDQMRRPDGSLWRVFHGGRAHIDAFLEDYGDLASGLTALYQATFEPRYLEAAAALNRIAVERFWDPERAAYLTAPRGQADLLLPTYGLFDNAFPSGASTLTEAQVALAALTGQSAPLSQAERYLSRLRAEMLENPLGYGHLLVAADSFLDGAAAVTLAARSDERGPFLAERRRHYAPTVAWAAFDPDQPLPAVLSATTAGKERVGGRAAAYLCRRFVCELPLTEPAALAQRLHS